MTLALNDELASLAGEVAEQMGNELRLRRPDDLPFRQKEDAKGEVTDLDEWAEAEIARRILERRPDDGFLGEEGLIRPSKTGVVWKVDPIDGSVNYIRGIPGWTVVISAERSGVPLAAAVFDPSTVGSDGRAGELFLTNGVAVTVNGKVVHPNERASFGKDALIGVGYESDPEVRALQGATFAKWFPAVRDIRRAGSSVREAVYVTAGRSDAFYGFLYPYETSAVRAFVAASGAAISLERVPSSRHAGLHRVVVAATQAFHAELSSAIKSAELSAGLVVGGRLAF